MYLIKTFVEVKDILFTLSRYKTHHKSTNVHEIDPSKCEWWVSSLLPPKKKKLRMWTLHCIMTNLFHVYYVKTHFYVIQFNIWGQMCVLFFFSLLFRQLLSALHITPIHPTKRNFRWWVAVYLGKQYSCHDKRLESDCKMATLDARIWSGRIWSVRLKSSSVKFTTLMKYSISIWHTLSIKYSGKNLNTMRKVKNMEMVHKIPTNVFKNTSKYLTTYPCSWWSP